MSETPWIDRRSLLEITQQSRGGAGLVPLDMGYVDVFKNGETRHCSDDSEAYNFYADNKERLDSEPTI